MGSVSLEILSAEDALNFIPKSPTAAIRIFSKDNMMNKYYRPLRSPFYKAIFEYTFDDLVHLSPKDMDKLSGSTEDEDLEFAFYSNDLAKRVVSDFLSVRNEIDCLMVHCRMGSSRSPAIAMALNEIFKLGNDPNQLRVQYPKFNETIYQMTLNAGKEIIG